MNIPFFPPDMFDADREHIYDLVERAGLDSSFILKENVKELEERMRQAVGSADAIGVHSGTGALAVALRSLDIGKGDEVIVQAFCCQPVASEVINVGAVPVFVDVTASTMVMDPARIEERITERTKAIIPAHLFSCMVDMPAVMAIADRHGLGVIEDACVVQGASLDGRPAGRWGHLGTYSFFQMKVMGGCGEGGMIVTDDPALGNACRLIRNHGQSPTQRFHYERLGVNSRMDEIMAGFLLRRFERLDAMLARRAEIAQCYHSSLASLAGRIVLPPPGTQGRCYYMYVIQTPERDVLAKYLAERGISTQAYYPRSLPSQAAFREWAPQDREIPNSLRASRQNLALPIYPHLSDSQVEYVAQAVLRFFSERKASDVDRSFRQTIPS